MTNLSFTPIYPKKINIDAYKRSLWSALRAEAKEHKKMLEGTCSNWTEKPNFKTKFIEKGNDVTASTSPSGNPKVVQKWYWVNNGTKRHPISAKKAPTLRFRTGYVPRTNPKLATSGKSSRFGPWVTPKSVNHPGIKPRDFIGTIQRMREKRFETRMYSAMKWAALRTFF